MPGEYKRLSAFLTGLRDRTRVEETKAKLERLSADLDRLYERCECRLSEAKRQGTRRRRAESSASDSAKRAREAVERKDGEIARLRCELAEERSRNGKAYADGFADGEASGFGECAELMRRMQDDRARS
jgi:chromosome segregation ATPase